MSPPAALSGGEHAGMERGAGVLGVPPGLCGLDHEGAHPTKEIAMTPDGALLLVVGLFLGVCIGVALCLHTLFQFVKRHVLK